MLLCVRARALVHAFSVLQNGYRVSFPGIKRPEDGLYDPPSCIAEVKETVEFTPTPPLCLHGRLQGVLYLDLYFSIFFLFSLLVSSFNIFDHTTVLQSYGKPNLSNFETFTLSCSSVLLTPRRSSIILCKVFWWQQAACVTLLGALVRIRVGTFTKQSPLSRISHQSHWSQAPTLSHANTALYFKRFLIGSDFASNWQRHLRSIRKCIPLCMVIRYWEQL